ncbi:MAG: hypothetical protein A2046_16165 [Bacteroidetes bacterium GWA2_30_7]|nr:MAG: hypothetical protein A2046_16165 [Bacteroidetes bacterium GWA2_30_7]
MKSHILTILFIVSCNFALFSQNIAITDDDTYTANSSAMLDVKSLSKGLLVPRLTTFQRTSVTSPATGLLVFDTNLNSFYYWNGTSWTNLTSGSASGIWGYSAPNIYLNNTNDKLGIGTATPFGKMEVKSDVSLGTNDPIFQVVNNNGDTVFAVYQQGVRVNVEDGVGKATGSKGGFAVGGFSPSKGIVTNEFLRVTPDSVRIYIEDDPAKATGSKGGFAVGGFSPSKTSTINYLDLTPENYFIGHDAGSAITIGLYNSFMGYNCGLSNTTGSYNTFMGYKAGNKNLSAEGNIAIGTYAGENNVSGWYNVFVGFDAGKKNLASNNTFVGTGSGHENTIGLDNTFYGNSSGYGNSTGNDNTYIGVASGGYNFTGNYNTHLGSYSGGGGDIYQEFIGNYNVFIGYKSGDKIISNSKNTFLGTFSGYNNLYGNRNVFLGFRAGFNETTSDKLYIANGATIDSTLIYGDFSNKVLYTKAKVSINNTTTPTSYLEVVDNSVGNDAPSILAQHSISNNWGVGLTAIGGYKAILAQNTSTSGYNYGIDASATGSGGTANYGIYSNATTATTNYGIYSTASGGTTNWAGYFQGNVHVNGTLSKSGGTFKIDHPQDPENKYLIHSFVESPDMKNIYDGVVTLDNQGKATITLPSYFSSLNKDFRYQLTAIGAAAPNLHIEQKIQNNSFTIAGGSTGMEVSWQITGSRKDPYAIKNPIMVEQEKLPEEKGKYLNPDLYNQPIEKSIHKISEK